MKLNTGAWVVVCDAGKYLILENRGDEEMMDLRVVDHEALDNPPAHAQGADRPGRLRALGEHRSALETTDWHDVAEEQFADHLAHRLAIDAYRDRFCDLVLVSDATTLGRLRKALPAPVKTRLRAEIVGDFAHRTTEVIEEKLRAA